MVRLRMLRWALDGCISSRSLTMYSVFFVLLHAPVLAQQPSQALSDLEEVRRIAIDSEGHCEAAGIAAAPLIVRLIQADHLDESRIAAYVGDGEEPWVFRYPLLDVLTRRNGIQHAGLLRQIVADPSTADALRGHAIDCLVLLSDRDSVPTLTSSLSDSSAGVRRRAAIAVGRLASGQLAPMLAGLLEDEDDTNVRVAIIGALGDFQSAEYSHMLLQLARTERQIDSRLASINALGKIGTEDVARDLVSFLAEYPGSGRSVVLKALGRNGTETAVRALLDESQSDAEYYANLAAREAYGIVQDKPQFEQLLEEALSRFKGSRSARQILQHDDGSKAEVGRPK